MQAECIALCFGKCGAFVEPRIHQQIEAGQAGADYGGVASGEAGESCSLKAISPYCSSMIARSHGASVI